MELTAGTTPLASTRAIRNEIITLLIDLLDLIGYSDPAALRGSAVGASRKNAVPAGEIWQVFVFMSRDSRPTGPDGRFRVRMHRARLRSGSGIAMSLETRSEENAECGKAQVQRSTGQHRCFGSLRTSRHRIRLVKLPLCLGSNFVEFSMEPAQFGVEFYEAHAMCRDQPIRRDPGKILPCARFQVDAGRSLQRPWILLQV